MQTIINVGHGAYNGANAQRMCFSKAQAIRVLRNRGVLRNAARDAVKVATASTSGYATVRCGYEVIEVTNEEWAISQGHFGQSREELRRHWRRYPED